MKTVFIINPKAGKSKDINKLKVLIKQAADSVGCPIEVYVTKFSGDATIYVSDYIKTKGRARFIAVGGDGTLNEVLNGTKGFSCAQVGVIPLGTGNDFCRNFPDRQSFYDIEAQLTGSTVLCDAIRYKTSFQGEEKDGYCVNMMNIGFDCNVADMTSVMKTKPFISGPFAYFISILIMLITKKGANLRIKTDGKIVHTGPLLLTSVANGCFCGGGIMSNPTASVQDGFININIIKDVSRLKFISLLPSYMKGTFLKLKGIDKIVQSIKCKKVVIEPNTSKFKVANDGEIVDSEVLELEIVHNAFNFVLPSKKAVLTV